MRIIEQAESTICDICEEEYTKTIIDFGELNLMLICDKCMQELNRKIVNHLADKHL